MKSGWEKYASEKRYVQKGYFRKHSDGGSGRKAREASRCDSLQQSRKEQKEVAIESYGKTVLLTEQVVPNEPFTEDEALALSVYEKALKEAAPILKEIYASNGSNGVDETRGDAHTQQSCSSGSVVDVQNVPGKQSGSKRKKTNSKKPNGRLQKQKGE